MKSQRSKKLTAVLRARLMPAEKQLLIECAEESGATLSQWTRKVLLEAVGGWKERRRSAVSKNQKGQESDELHA